MSWETWVIGISVGVVAAAFVVLVIYLVLLLQSLRHTLQRSDLLLQDLERKMHSLDPYFNVARGLGEVIEKKACAHCDPIEKKTSAAFEVMDWALMGWGLWNKIREGRR